MAIFFALPGNEALAVDLAHLTGGVMGDLEVREFPDGETYVRMKSDVRGARASLVCTLARPATKILPLLFAAATLREHGAAEVILVAPYLPYLRQDMAFQPGEALTSRDFANLLSEAFDAIFTVDPHLHRYRALSEVYRTRATAVHAAPLLADWVMRHVERPLLVGPDAESEQWVKEIAALAGAPHIVLTKRRLGDRAVRLKLPEVAPWRGCDPVLADDMISTGTTVFEAASLLLANGFSRPACLAVHALHSQDVATKLAQVTSGVWSTDSIPHPSNCFRIAPLVAKAISTAAGARPDLGFRLAASDQPR